MINLFKPAARWMLWAILLQVSAQSALGMEPIWKRSFALEQDLARALNMNSQDLCSELDEFSCLRYAHQYALGGHEPFEKGQFQGQADPSLTTAVAFERVILAACGARVKQDEALLNEQRYFTFIDLEKPVADQELSAIQQQVELLYRNFLSRDAEPAEVLIISSLVEDKRLAGRIGRDLARMLCFVVGSQSEFLFF